MTLSEWMQECLTRRERERLRDVRNDRSRVRHHVDFDPIGAVPIVELDRYQLREWMGRMLAKQTRSRGRTGKLRARTVRNVLTLVRVSLDVAVDEALIDANPARELRVPRSARAHTEDVWTVLEPDEQARVLRETGSMRHGPMVDAMVRVAIGTGLRRGELLALRGCDVEGLDTLRPRIVVRFSAPGRPTKGGSPRRVPLFGVALAAMRTWIGLDEEWSAFPVFPGRCVSKHRRKVPTSTFVRALRAAGVQRDVRWHDLRHTCATSLLEGWWGRAWSVVEVQQLLGHRSPVTTERYLHARGSAAEHAARDHAHTVGGEKTGPPFRDLAFRRERDVGTGQMIRNSVHGTGSRRGSGGVEVEAEKGARGAGHGSRNLRPDD